jgi:NitT/TauT family transport system substrate-binding protein
MVARFISGEAQIGILPPNVAAKLYASGRPLAVAAVVGKGMLSFISGDTTVYSLADLRGKEIYMAGQGATPDFVFRKILAASGINPEKDVSLRYSMAYPEMAQSLISGRITYAVLPEPFATMALMGKPSLRVPFNLQKEWSLSGGSPHYPMTVLVVDTHFAAEKGSLLKVLLESYEESVSWTVENPALAGVLAEKYELGLKASIAAASIPKSAYGFTLAKDARGDLEALFRVFLAYAPSSIGGKLPDNSFYYSSE